MNTITTIIIMVMVTAHLVSCFHTRRPPALPPGHRLYLPILSGCQEEAAPEELTTTR